MSRSGPADVRIGRPVQPGIEGIFATTGQLGRGGYRLEAMRLKAKTRTAGPGSEARRAKSSRPPLRRSSLKPLLRHFAGGQFFVPLVHQRPVEGAGAEVGHVQIAFQPLDRFVEHRVVLAEDRAMAGQQPLDVAVANSLQRTNEGLNVAAMMGVDRPTQPSR